MATAGEASLPKDDITTCSICLETFTEPKVLPCIHTFCLRCLDSYCAKNKFKKEVECPLCRGVYPIPPGGIGSLSSNFFMLQLIDVNKCTVADEARVSDKTILCELCSDSDEVIASSCHCIECDQHFCDKCAAGHMKFKLFKTHHVIRDDSVPNPRFKLENACCDEHPDEQNRLYCYDCKMIMCHKCHVSKHNQHKWSDADDSAKNFCEQLKEDVETVSNSASRKQDEIIQLETDLKNFLAIVASTENEISQKFDQVISVVQSQKSDLIKELNKFKDTEVKKIETRKDEIERQCVIRESFVRYCKEMMDKGTACDISRTAHDLHARAEELVKTQDEPDCHKLSRVEITFEPSLLATDSGKNSIGELVFRDKPVLTMMSDGKGDQNLCLTNFLERSTLFYVMPCDRLSITGIAVLGNNVFVTRSTSQVYVYNCNNLMLINQLTIPDANRLNGIVACSHFGCLYAVDTVRRVIYRYDVKYSVTTKWAVDGECHGLFVTRWHNVLAVLHDCNRLQEYTTHGSLIRTICHDSRVNGPVHCVQQSTGNFVVSQIRGKDQRVSIVDQQGQCLLSRFVIDPRHLAVDEIDNVLVATGGSGISVLSPTLNYLGDVVIHVVHRLNGPDAVHYDERNHRLYVGERIGGRIFVLDC